MIKGYKKIGQTPLQYLNELRENNPELKDERLSYAGRLDPIAEGEMLVMVGDENDRREDFLGCDKTYEVDILFGFGTDTYDVLGLVNSVSDVDISLKELKKVLKKIKKVKEIKYPVYSSKSVFGKPLWQWEREGRIDEIDIPKRDIKVKKVKLLNTYEINAQDLYNYISFVIGEVSGDFRQEEILNCWKENIDNGVEYKIARVRFKVSTGTYIRGLVDLVGKELGCDGCILKLNRVKIFDYV
jgi:tRNA pseudouridine(55) synthase